MASSVTSGLNISLHLGDVLGALGEGERAASETGVSLDGNSQFSGADLQLTPIEEDFNQLQTAALEGLDRKSLSYKAVLPGTDGEGRMVPEVLDLRRVPDKRELMQRVSSSDPEAIIVHRMRERMQRVGLHLKTVEVRWRDVRVDTTLNVGSFALPTLPNAAVGMIKGLLKPFGLGRRTEVRVILKDISGVLKPGRLTLLLGLPGAGKSTLMKVLAGQVSKDKRLRCSGEVRYNGVLPRDFVVERVCAYVDQVDDHIPDLTVRETLNFSAQCRRPSAYTELMEELTRREAAMGVTPDPEVVAVMKAMSLKGKDNLRTMYFMKQMGLDVCANTMVGSNMVRGISGGQIKRLTTAEMLTGQMRVCMLDEISTGLDSATTLQVVTMLRDLAHNMDLTAMVSLLQPPPETVALFDDIMLMAEGRVVYHGPLEGAQPFAESLGFRRPPGTSLQEFLQAVHSDKDQQGLWDSSRPFAPVTAEMACDAFRGTAQGHLLAATLAVPYREPEEDAARTEVLEKSPYALSSWEVFMVCMQREWKLLKRGKAFMIFRLFQVVLVGLVAGSLFWQIPHNTVADGSAVMGFMFFSLLNMMFGGAPEIALTIQRLPVLFKHRDYRFFPAWAYVLPNTLLRMPQGILDVILWTNIVYWMVGLSPNASNYFMFMLILFVMHQVGVTMFRALATLCRSMEIAQGIFSFYILIVQLASGFINTGDAIPPWWLWAYWWSPTAYAIRAISINEFTSAQWDKPTPGLPNMKLGDATLKARGFYTEYFWVWVGVAVLVAQSMMHVVLQILMLAYLQPLRGTVTVIRTRQDSKKATPAAANAITPTAGDSHNHAVVIGESNGHGADGTPQPAPLWQSGSNSGHYGRLEDESPPVSERISLGLGPVQPRPSATASSNDTVPGEFSELRMLPISMTFQDVHYFVALSEKDRRRLGAPKGQQLELLKGITGSFRPGVLTALMGESGAGKTTLMDCLAGRKTYGNLVGDVRINGFQKDQPSFNRYMGYCEQTDIHSPQMTVREAIHFSARLRLPAITSNNTVCKWVEHVMELVELIPLRDGLIGLPGVSGLSVEQRKRLTIAVELAGCPSVMFMDEPTSGLDARAAAIVMRVVRNTVNTGRTVVATVHQPSPEIFSAFNELILLKRGGEAIYCGPLGPGACDMVSYFEAIEGVLRCQGPEGDSSRNPASWMLDVTTPQMEQQLGVDFAQLFKSSKLAAETSADVAKLAQPPEKASGVICLQDLPTQKLGLLRQASTLLHKFFVVYWRNPQYNLTRFILTVIIGSMFGSMYWGSGHDINKYSSVLNIMGSMFSSVIFLGSSNMGMVMPLVFAERAVYYRDRAAGVYGPLPYVAAQTIVELPYVLVQSLLYTNIIFFMIGYPLTAAHYLWYNAAMFVSLLLFNYLGQACGSFFPTQQVAQVVGQVTLIPLWNIVGGFLYPQPMMPPWWGWFAYTSPVYWILYLLMTTQLGDMTSSFIISPSTGQRTSVPDFLTSMYGFEYSWRWAVLAILVGFSVLFRVLALLSYRFVNHQRR